MQCIFERGRGRGRGRGETREGETREGERDEGKGIQCLVLILVLTQFRLLHFCITALSDQDHCIILQIKDMLGTSHFVLCREVVLFRRLFCTECVYNGTSRLSFVGRFVLLVSSDQCRTLH